VTLRIHFFHTCEPASGTVGETLFLGDPYTIEVFCQKSVLDDKTLGGPICKLCGYLRPVLGVFCHVAYKTPPALPTITPPHGGRSFLLSHRLRRLLCRL
jgi:hypothetical protein